MSQFCMKCGKENKDNAAFCFKCGAPLASYVKAQKESKQETETTLSRATYANENNEPNANSQNRGSSDLGYDRPIVKKSRKKLFIGLAGAAVVAIIVLAVMLSNSAKTISLKDYVQLNYSGPNGYATVSATIDNTRLREDAFIALGYNAKDINNGNIYASHPNAVYDQRIVEDLIYYTSITTDQEKRYSNGDEIEASVKYYGSMATDKLIIEDGEVKEKVQGLEEAVSLDLFKGVNISFSGIMPEGKATVECDNDYSKFGISYEPNKSSGLSNGDTITLRAIYDEQLLLDEGYVVEEGEKEYKVEGLSKYITELKEIPLELENKMLSELDDFVMSMYADDEGRTIKNYQLLGYYLLTPKKQTVKDSWNNQLYIVYKADINQIGKDYEEDVTAYKYIRYKDLMLYADGTGYVDLLDYTNPVVPGIWYFGDEDYYFESANGEEYAGFKDLNSLENQCIIAQKNSWNVETSIKG